MSLLSLYNQCAAAVESLGMTLESLGGVSLDLDCDVRDTPDQVTRFSIEGLPAGGVAYTLFTVCLESGVDYRLSLEYTSFNPVFWLADSVSAVHG